MFLKFIRKNCLVP